MGLLINNSSFLHCSYRELGPLCHSDFAWHSFELCSCDSLVLFDFCFRNFSLMDLLLLIAMLRHQLSILPETTLFGLVGQHRDIYYEALNCQHDGFFR